MKLKVSKRCNRCGKRDALKAHLKKDLSKIKWLCCDCDKVERIPVGLMGWFANMDDLRSSVNRLESGV